MFRGLVVVVVLALLTIQRYAIAEQVRIGDISLHYTVHGTGPAVLLLHGYTSSGNDSWKGIVPGLSQHFKLYVVDLRGHGKSTFSKQPYSHALVANDIVGLLDYLKLDSVAAIGASSGANALLHLTTSHPDRIHSMILVACGQYLPQQARDLLSSKEVMETFLSDSNLSKIHVGGKAQWDYIRHGMQGLCQKYTDMNFTPPLLGTIEARTLIMQGDRDQFFPIEMPVELYKSIPDSELWIVPGADHNLFYPPGAVPELEAEFVRRATKFLTTRFFDSNGLRLACSIRGEGEPVVILNGMTSSKTGWESLQARLIDSGFQVIALDCRGHGESEKPHDAVMYGAEMAKDVVRLLDHLDLEQVHLVGYSMGAHIANKVREVAPGRIRSLAVGGITWPTTKGWTTNDYDIQNLARSLRTGNGWTEFLLQPGAVRRGVIPMDEAQKLNDELTNGQDNLAIAAVIEAYEGLNVSDKSLKENDVPMLIVMGEEDPGFDSAKSMREASANCRFQVVRGANHFNAAPDERTLSAIVGFLTEGPE